MKFFSILIFLTFIMISYQNCSIYESEGRTLLESEGATIYQQKITNASCDLYFNDYFLQEIFKTEPYETIFTINTKQEVVCRIVTLKREYECKFSSEYANWLHQLPSHIEMIPDSVRLSMQYEQLGVKNNDSNKLIFIMNKDLLEAVGCSVNYSDETRDQDLSLLATFAQSMFEQSVQTRP